MAPSIETPAEQIQRLTVLVENQQRALGKELTIGEVCRRAFANAEKHGFHEAQGASGDAFASSVMNCVCRMSEAVELDRKADGIQRQVWLGYAEVTLASLRNGEHAEPCLFDTQAMLMVTELAEAVVGFRKGDMENVAEELADTIIRIADTAVQFGLDLEGALRKKL